MTDIQRARDVISKWRKESTSGLWFLDFEAATFYNNESTAFGGYIGDTDRPHDARLVVGTAGNPDLLDAIDGLLELAGDGGVVPATTRWYAERIAAAILSADERMSA